VRFTVSHDFDIPLDALELAALSPHLADRLVTRLPNIESIVQKEHRLEAGSLARVLAYQANIQLPAFARSVVTKDMLAWEERSRYDLASHRAEWTVVANVKPEWQKYFASSGTYTLVPIGEAKTKRVVEGEIRLNVPVFRTVAERLIFSEVKKTFEAEAATLRELGTLV
jgi:hypothetical protein